MNITESKSKKILKTAMVSAASLMLVAPLALSGMNPVVNANASRRHTKRVTHFSKKREMKLHRREALRKKRTRRMEQRLSRQQKRFSKSYHQKLLTTVRHGTNFEKRNQKTQDEYADMAFSKHRNHGKKFRRVQRRHDHVEKVMNHYADKIIYERGLLFDFSHAPVTTKAGRETIRTIINNPNSKTSGFLARYGYNQINDNAGDGRNTLPKYKSVKTLEHEYPQFLNPHCFD